MNIQIGQIVKLKPHLTPKIWAGELLSSIKGAGDNIGESWEISTLSDGSSLIDSLPLSALRGEHPEFWGDKRCQFPH